jgi:GDP-mannose 6-dehydrogenase
MMAQEVSARAIALERIQPRVAVIGMGYVGAVSSAALASRGCRVIGVEVSRVKLDMLRQGRSPVCEPGVDDAMRAAVRAGRFTATDRIDDAVRHSDIVMICVGTPSGDDGQVDLQAIDRVTSQLGEALRHVKHRVVVMIRSTVPPGTTRDRVASVLRAANPRTTVCHHPEFLREGSAMKDWAAPPMIVYGSDDRDRDEATHAIEMLYHGIDAPRLPLDTTESELMKYACNVFHAVKIDFANEIGSVAAAVGADPARVMDAMCHDRKLNISPAYLRPGFAFGGSCLPKDTRAIVGEAHRNGMRLPLIESVLTSNSEHLRRAVDRILRHGRKRTLLVGLSFKAGTDDLRESPMVELAERLLGKGIPLSIYDDDLLPNELVGANARYVHEHLPHLHLLLRDDLVDALRQVETVVIVKGGDALQGVDFTGKTVIDLSAGPATHASETAARRVA